MSNVLSSILYFSDCNNLGSLLKIRAYITHPNITNPTNRNAKTYLIIVILTKSIIKIIGTTKKNINHATGAKAFVLYPSFIDLP